MSVYVATLILVAHSALGQSTIPRMKFPNLQSGPHQHWSASRHWFDPLQGSMLQTSMRVIFG
jgi:hypothetical protein